MKKIVITLTLLASVAAVAQNYSVPTFVDTLDMGNNVPRVAIARTTSGRIFTLPYVTPNVNPQVQKVAVFDSSMNLLHTTAYQIDSATVLYPDRFFGLGANHALSVTNVLYNNAYSTMFVTLDTTGQVESAYRCGGWGTACPTHDGGYVICGIDSNKVVRMDSANNILWEYRYVPPAGWSFQADDVIEYAPTGEITVKGSVGMNQPDSGFTAIIRLSPNGTVLWAKRFHTKLGSNIITSFSLNQSEFNGELYLEYIDPTGTLILGLDASGSVMWYNGFARTGCTAGSMANNFFDGYGGFIYLSSVYSCPPMGGGIDVLCINKYNGSLMWTKTAALGFAGFSYPQYGRDIRYSSSFKMFARVNDAISTECIPNTGATSNTCTIFNLPYEMNIGFTANSVSLNQLSLPYVNLGPVSLPIVQNTICDNMTAVAALPHNDGLTISQDQNTLVVQLSAFDAMNAANYALYDIQGREIKSGVVVSSTTAIDVNEMAPGVYLFRLEYENGTATNRKICIGCER